MTTMSLHRRRRAPLLLGGLVVLLLATGMTLHAPMTPLRTVDNQAFGFGERLDYDVGYKFITAGKASFIVGPEPVMIDGRKCYDIRFDVASLESLDWLYRVRDRYRTYVDIDGIFPWKFEQRIREGNYKRDFTATFDQVEKKARTTDGTFDVPPFVHDVVSAFYFVRTHDLKKLRKGQTIALKNFFDKQSYDLEVKILGRQRIEVKAGTFDCVVIEPLVKEGGLFKSDGRILIWLSDDDRKIPVKVSTKVVIGSIDAELTGYRGLRGPLSARVTTPD